MFQLHDGHEQARLVFRLEKRLRPKKQEVQKRRERGRERERKKNTGRTRKVEKQRAGRGDSTDRTMPCTVKSMTSSKSKFFFDPTTKLSVTAAPPTE